MYLEIISPDKKIFAGEVNAVKLPGADGSFGVLNDHAPIIASLKRGIVKVTENNNSILNFEINGGVVEVLKNKMIVLTE